jgi:hypothetical protein
MQRAARGPHRPRAGVRGSARRFMASVEDGYEVRSASSGSTREARRAGSQLASSATRRDEDDDHRHGDGIAGVRAVQQFGEQRRGCCGPRRGQLQRHRRRLAGRHAGSSRRCAGARRRARRESRSLECGRPRCRPGRRAARARRAGVRRRRRRESASRWCAPHAAGRPPGRQRAWRRPGDRGPRAPEVGAPDAGAAPVRPPPAPGRSGRVCWPAARGRYSSAPSSASRTLGCAALLSRTTPTIESDWASPGAVSTRTTCPTGFFPGHQRRAAHSLTIATAIVPSRSSSAKARPLTTATSSVSKYSGLTATAAVGTSPGGSGVAIPSRVMAGEVPRAPNGTEARTAAFATPGSRCNSRRIRSVTGW